MILFSFPREIIACRFSSERADKKNLKPGLPLFVLLRLRLHHFDQLGRDFDVGAGEETVEALLARLRIGVGGNEGLLGADRQRHVVRAGGHTEPRAMER